VDSFLKAETKGIFQNKRRKKEKRKLTSLRSPRRNNEK
jgi:hypothetical protein